jgi:hypothetical protein
MAYLNLIKTFFKIIIANLFAQSVWRAVRRRVRNNPTENVVKSLFIGMIQGLMSLSALFSLSFIFICITLVQVPKKALDLLRFYFRKVFAS